LWVKAVILDFDGTIYDSFPNGLRGAKDMFKEIGRRFFKGDEALIREMWGDSLISIIAALFPEENALGHRQLLKLWLECMEKRDKKTPPRLIPGTNAALKALKKMGLTIVIATNRSAETLYEALLISKLNLAHVDFIIAPNSSRAFAKFLAKRKAHPPIAVTPYKKPDPRYLIKLNRFLAKREILPSQTVLAGDTLVDAVTANIGKYGFIPVLTGAIGNSNAWWEASLAEENLPKVAIASSVKDMPLLIQTLRLRHSFENNQSAG
jgi:phosphoglycolate phosphatase-like HAD superfamily hydrolase